MERETFSFFSEGTFLLESFEHYSTFSTGGNSQIIFRESTENVAGESKLKMVAKIWAQLELDKNRSKEHYGP